MRRFVCILTMIAAFVLGLACAVSAADDQQPVTPEPEKVTLKMSVKAREVRDYKIDAVVKGKLVMPESPEPVDVDAVLALKVRHAYGRREEDGLTPLDITLLEGQFTTQGQKLEIAPSLYPKITVLFNRDMQISDIYGMTSSELSQTLPGINYGNHIILFFPQGYAQPRAIGDKWDSTLTIPNYGQTYKFANVLKGIEDVNGIKAAVLKQEITTAPKEDSQGGSATMKATVESAFSLEGGKLLKSHVECEVQSIDSKSGAPRQDPRAPRANIRMDISLAK